MVVEKPRGLLLLHRNGNHNREQHQNQGFRPPMLRCELTCPQDIRQATEPHVK